LQNYYIIQTCGILIVYSFISWVICLILYAVGISPVLLSYLVTYFQFAPPIIGIIGLDSLLVVRRSKFRRRIAIDLALMIIVLTVLAVIYPLLGTSTYDFSALLFGPMISLSAVAFQGLDIMMALGWRKLRKNYKCSICGEKAPFILTDHRLEERKTRKTPFCLDHFIEAFRSEWAKSGSMFIFFLREAYYMGYIFLSLDDLWYDPLQYSEAEMSQMASMLDNKGNRCRKQDGPAAVLVIEAGLIGNPKKKPLIKDEGYLESRKPLCTEHFLHFLKTTIREKRFFEMNLPYAKEGIYFPRLPYDCFYKF